jgi:quinol monooxygenase YgiN
MEKYCIYGKLTATPGHLDELLTYMREVVKEMEQVKDCNCYILGKSELEPDSIFIYEIWENQAAHDASLSLDVFKDLIAKARPIIAGMENFHQLTILDGKASL